MRDFASRLRATLRAPVAGAVAGIAFAILLIVILVTIRMSVPADLRDQGAWTGQALPAVSRAVHLVPFAAIAFLWFIGVLRHAVGALEDRLFASVFLGSGLLFLAMLLASSAVASALIEARTMLPGGPVEPATYAFARSLAHGILYVHAMRFAGIFMMSTSAIGLRTGFMPRWMAVLGFALALVLLLGVSRWAWMPLVFPAWVLVVSGHALKVHLGQAQPPAASA